MGDIFGTVELGEEQTHLLRLFEQSLLRLWLRLRVRQRRLQQRLLLTAAEKMGRVRPIFFAPVGDSP